MTTVLSSSPRKNDALVSSEKNQYEKTSIRDLHYFYCYREAVKCILIIMIAFVRIHARSEPIYSPLKKQSSRDVCAHE